MRSRYILFLTISLIVLALDLITKKLALENLANSPPVEIIPGFFNLVLVFNSGAAFGIFNDPNSTWQIWLFLAVTLITVCIIIYLLKSMVNDRLSFLGLALIMGGALGNLVDRVRYQAVVDFLDFYIGNWHWPAFNVADIGICVGAGLVIAALWAKPGMKKKKRV